MGKYKVLKKLGQGSYGTVFLVQDSKDGRLFVMKKITVSGMAQSEIEDCKREIQILSMLKHPNIIGYQRSFIRRGALCIVMNFADNGDLHHLIHRQRRIAKSMPNGSIEASFIENFVLDTFTQVALGLRHMHRHKILHRDLKTQNIFLTKSGEVRLGDFGISRVMKNTMDQARTLVGTPYYLSPEMVNGQPYDSKTDMWSLGVVLYEMLTLEHPFNADSLQMLALRIIQGNYPPIPAHYSPEINDLLSMLLEQNASKRLNIEELLQHPMIEPRVRRFEEMHRQNELSNSKKMLVELENQKPAKALVRHDEPQRQPVQHHASYPLTTQQQQQQQHQQQQQQQQHLYQQAQPNPQEQYHAPQPMKVAPTPDNGAMKRDLQSHVSPAVPLPTQHHFMPTPPAPMVPPLQTPPQGSAKISRPKAESPHNRQTSLQVHEDMMEDEPDWEVKQPTHPAPPMQPNRMQQSPRQSRSESVQSRAYQVGILRTHLQQRLGDNALESLLDCLKSESIDDDTKAAQVEQLIRSQHEILPIVHTLIYLEQRL